MHMKKIVSLIVGLVLTIALQAGNDLEDIKIIDLKINPVSEIGYAYALIDLNYIDISSLDLGNEFETVMEQVDCTVTVCATLGNPLTGSISITLTATGPCDEIYTAATSLLNSIVAYFNKHWDEIFR